MAETTIEEYSDISRVVLTLTLDNSQPIELGAFVSAFTSIASDYKKMLENKGVDADAEIYITEVRSGSIVADLMPVVATAFPAIAASVTQVSQAIDFVNTWKDRLSKLSNRIVPEGLSRSELKTFTDAVEAVRQDPNGNQTLEAATFEDGRRQVKAAFKFNTNDAREIKNTIDAEFKRLEDKTEKTHIRVLMTFTRTDVGDAPIEKRSGERAVINSISERDLPIMYASELAEQRIKHEIRDAEENIYNKAFNVDVAVQFRGEKAIVYKVLEVHQVIDLSGDD